MKRIRPVARPGRLKGAEMAELRDAVYLRDNGRCQMCGKWCGEGDWDLSHKRGKRMWGDSLETTEVACKTCHQIFHSYGKTMTKPCPKK